MLRARERSNVRDRWTRHAAETFRGADAAGGDTVSISRPLGRPETLCERLHRSPLA